MNLVNITLVGSQAVLGLVSIGVGGAKVTSWKDQADDFERFGYPQWFLLVVGVVEIGAGTGLIAGLLGLSRLTLAGGLLLSSVLLGAVVTHIRTDDPVSKTAIPALLFVVTVGLLVVRYSSVPM